MFPEEERIYCDACLTAYLTVTLAVPLGERPSWLAAATRCAALRHTPQNTTPKARYDLPRRVTQLAWQKSEEAFRGCARSLSCSPSTYHIYLRNEAAGLRIRFKRWLGGTNINERKHTPGCNPCSRG